MMEHASKRSDYLSDDMKVAAEIYRLNEVEEEPVYFSKLLEDDNLNMEESRLEKLLDSLLDWEIVRGRYGENEKGEEGRLLYISSESRDVIADSYDVFWREERWRKGVKYELFDSWKDEEEGFLGKLL